MQKPLFIELNIPLILDMRLLDRGDLDFIHCMGRSAQTYFLVLHSNDDTGVCGYAVRITALPHAPGYVDSASRRVFPPFVRYSRAAFASILPALKA